MLKISWANIANVRVIEENRERVYNLFDVMLSFAKPVQLKFREFHYENPVSV